MRDPTTSDRDGRAGSQSRAKLPGQPIDSPNREAYNRSAMRSVYAVIAAFSTVSLCHAGFLVGIAADANSPNSATGVPYLIDPMTGATTVLTQPFDRLYLVAGDSPYPATIFGSSTVNLYTANFATGVASIYSSEGSALDLAYDSGHNVLYASLGDDRLATIPVIPCTFPPCQPETVVGNFTLPIFAMGYVPGDGLYGVDPDMGTLWRIDVNTAALIPVGPTGVGLLVNGLSITDIEFDSATGRLIASAGGPEPVYPGSGTPFASGKIYLLDRFTGATTLLNDNAPNFFSLAEVSPEPVSLILVGGALLALGLRSRFRGHLSARSHYLG